MRSMAGVGSAGVGRHMQSDTKSPVTSELHGAVLVLWIDNPPVNALGAAVRAGLAAHLARANTDTTVRAVALLARGRTFPAGADISEFGKAPQEPSLPELCNQIEACTKPVVAGLHGTALGGGLEIALAAHARVGQADAKFGLPEVALGILPGAGGTQRLPRLIGAAEALRLMMTGKPIGAAKALSLGLLDKVVERDVLEASVSLALHLTADQAIPTRERRDGFCDAKAYFAAIAEARRAQATAPLPAPKRIVDCVEAAQLLPFEQGLAFERAAFAELVNSPEAEALRHVFFAERRMARMVGAKAAPDAVRHISILGAGADAVHIAQDLLAAGYDVTLVEQSADGLKHGLEAIANSLAEDLATDTLSQTEHDARWARVGAAITGDDSDAADMLLVTGPYRLRGGSVPQVSVKSGAPIVTLGRIGDGGRSALGLVLMPATRNGRLAEMLINDSTDHHAVATVLSVLKRLGRQVVQGQGAGINAGMALMLHVSLQAVEGQHGPEPVLDLLSRWGMLRSNDRSVTPPKGPVNLWSGVAPPVLAALANAGLRMIGDGNALRPSDIDVTLIVGHGFPRWGGGPMFWAQRRGLLVLRDDLNGLAEQNPDIWDAAPLLDDLIRQGISLNDLNDA
jgi:3-hydroxyacyl-CoA dehydrogenase